MVEMARLMRAGCTTAFTIDGPKGPRYVAKMGAVLLAKKTGPAGSFPLPLLPRVTGSSRVGTRSSCQSPSRAPRSRRAADFRCRRTRTRATLEARRDELQRALDELNRRGVEWRENKGIRDVRAPGSNVSHYIS